MACVRLKTMTEAHSRIYAESMCRQYFFVCDHVLVDLSIGDGKDPRWWQAELC